ncbi:Hypothetical protein J6892_00462 [Nakaseomyces glabratus]
MNKWSIYVLLISLISRVLSGDISGKTDDPSYVHDGDITGDAGYILYYGATVKEIAFNGNIKLPTYFSFEAIEPGSPGVLFTYHGGSIDLGHSVALYDVFATGPTTVKMTGDSFSGKGQMNLTASIREGSTAYLDFKTLYSLDTYFKNFQSVTYPATSTVSLSQGYLVNSDVFYEGPVSFTWIYDLSNSRMWFDDIDHATIPFNFRFPSGESGVNVKDSVATSGHDILLDSSFVKGPNYVGFDTKVMSINISSNDLSNTVLEVVTSRNTYHLIIDNSRLGFLRCATSKNFKIVQKTLDRNGTSVTLDAVMFNSDESFVCPDAKTSTVTDSTSFPGCTKYVSYAAAYDLYGHFTSVVLGSSSTCSFFTTTVSKDRLVEVDIVTYYIASDDTGEHVATKTITVKVEEPDYTTTITSGGHTITEVVSHITTTDSDGKTVTITTTMASFDQVDEGVFTSPEPYSQPPVVTSTVTEDDGSSKTVVISYFPSEGEDGVTRTGTTAISTITPAEQDYTTTITSDGHTITEVVSHITTTDSDGKTVTITTTMASFDQVDEGVFTSPEPYSQPPVVTSTVTEDDGSSKTVVISYFPSEGEDGVTRTGTTTISTITPAEQDYTTTITSGGHTITEVVSHITTTDSDGKTVTITTTMASFDQVDEGVFTSPEPYSQPPVVTSTVTEDDGSSKTVVISYFPSEGEDGVTRTGTTTVSTIIPEEPDYTTTIDKGNGDFETDLVSHITTKDSNGKPTTIVTTIPLKPSDGGEADYTTTIDKGNGDFETDLVSHITTKDSNGKPTTIVTTIPLKPSDGGEADYTTTIDKGNGEFETDLVSHITTKDSNGKPTTIVTTIPLKPSDGGGGLHHDDRQGQRGVRDGPRLPHHHQGLQRQAYHHRHHDPIEAK